MNEELSAIHRSLGIGDEQLKRNRLSYCEQAKLEDLEIVDLDFMGRVFVIDKRVTSAWRDLRRAATADGILLQSASGFRSYAHQSKLIENLLAGGRELNDILTGTAIPGFSEHHTGRAIDIVADPKIPENEFHLTDTYKWMLENAGRFDFTLSYPKDNALGIIFEPWHWLYKR